MKKSPLVLLVLLLAVSCAKEEFVADHFGELIPETEINNFISETTDQNEVFDWRKASSSLIHSASLHSDSVIAIGYRPSGQIDASKFIGTVETLPAEWLSTRKEILDDILELEREETRNPALTVQDILAHELDNAIPTVALKLTALGAIEYAKANRLIRYVEPMGYQPPVEIAQEPAQTRSSGCDGNPDNISIYDYTTTSSYNAKVPWNFYNHKINQAWSYSNGDNIGICIIDTGASQNQSALGSSFSSGNSPSRSIYKYSTHYSGSWWWKSLDSPHDQCGHGTSMAGLAAAPWGWSGNSVGVAYRANLYTYRAVKDVVISSSNEKNGVKNALKSAGNKSGIKIISMSIGNIISSGTVKDGIYYAYNRGKLIFAAAGTSTSFTNWTGVIFPANMSQTTAVTGVKAQSSYQRCNTCHSGSKVDFTIQMQRSWDSDRNSVGLATYSNTPKYVGGSSASTATTAGIAALVWATNPSMSRSTVLYRLRRASQLYNNKSSSYGYGNINARSAVLNTTY